MKAKGSPMKPGLEAAGHSGANLTPHSCHFILIIRGENKKDFILWASTQASDFPKKYDSLSQNTCGVFFDYVLRHKNRQREKSLSAVETSSLFLIFTIRDLCFSLKCGGN